MLYLLSILLMVLWILGLIAGVGGEMVHLLLALALIVFVLQLASGRSRPLP